VKLDECLKIHFTFWSRPQSADCCLLARYCKFACQKWSQSTGRFNAL